MADIQMELIDSYNGQGFAAQYSGFADRAAKDSAGHDFETTYAKTADLSNKVDKVDGKGLSENDYTDADKAKVDAIGAWTSGDYDVPLTVTVGGRVYPVVKIGNQLWTAENLDYAWTGLTVGGKGSYSEPRAYYYNNDSSTYGINGNRYGLLYNCAAAQYLTNAENGLLPSGWRVSTVTDWETLKTTLGYVASDTQSKVLAAQKLKSTTGWTAYPNGTDDYGFTAMPCGYKNDSSQFYHVDERAFFMTSNYNGSMYSCLYYIMDQIYYSNDMYSNTAASIRLVKDA